VPNPRASLGPPDTVCARPLRVSPPPRARPAPLWSARLGYRPALALGMYHTVLMIDDVLLVLSVSLQVLYHSLSRREPLRAHRLGSLFF
jgi:hypothetical protein